MLKCRMITSALLVVMGSVNLAWGWSSSCYCSQPKKSPLGLYRRMSLTDLCPSLSYTSKKQSFAQLKAQLGQNNENIDIDEKERSRHKNNGKNLDLSKSVKKEHPSRRDALVKSILTMGMVTTTSSISMSEAQAIELTSILQPADRRFTGKSSAAKRPTAYLVDSTIPPTLVPLTASRERSILRDLGKGLGTAKAPFVQDRLNLNNMMQKGVFGTIDAVKELLGGDSDDALNDVNNGGTDTGGTNKLKKPPASFVFFGMDWDSQVDAMLAHDLIKDIVSKRLSSSSSSTAIGLEFIPLSAQPLLDSYLQQSLSEEELTNQLVTNHFVDALTLSLQMPLFRWVNRQQNQSSSTSITLLALAPESADVRSVRLNGLQNLDPSAREKYVVDANGFINLTQDSKFKLYVDRSLFKDYTPLETSSDKVDGPGDFFAERILVHEAVATTLAKYAAAKGRAGCLVLTLAPTKDLRYMGGPNGRLPRVYNYLIGDNNNNNLALDDNAITTILLNPTAQQTLSQSKFLRLEIGTAPKNLVYQTKISDYLWFSSIPKVSLLPRLMNPI